MSELECVGVAALWGWHNSQVTAVSALPEYLADRYKIGRVLGRGGMADVYQAEDTVLGREVAVKVLRDPANRDRFQNEARNLAGLTHPGLVRVLDAGVTSDQSWLVMELVDGRTLADCCVGVALDPQRVAAVGAQLADTLAYVHASGFIHRDVKPGNVLISPDDRVLLADFGIARLLQNAPAATDTGTMLGTAAYLAPEQVRGDPLTPAADVYSLGLVLLEALTGERAYPGPAVEAAVARLTRPPTIPPNLPAGWRDLLTWVTAFDPADRPSPHQTAEKLRELAGGVDVATATTAFRKAETATRPMTVPLSQQDLPRTGSVDGGWVGRARRIVRSMTNGTWDRVLWVIAGVLAVAVVAVLVASAGHGPTVKQSPPRLHGVPGNVSTDLYRLDDAVNGR
jgi:serine/threonine protein kinase